jgi:signal peptidase I
MLPGSRFARVVLAFLVLAVGVGIAYALLGPDLKRYRQPSESMLPTIKLGSRFDANRDAYDGHDPEIGDLIVFHPPAPANGESGGLGPSGQCGVDYGGGRSCPQPARRLATVTFDKRVVAGPGDEVAIRGGHVILNGKLQREPFVLPCHPGDECDFPTPIEVPPDHWFLLGDNRGRSDDSRFWGPISRQSIIGRIDDCTLGVFCSPKH